MPNVVGIRTMGDINLDEMSKLNQNIQKITELLKSLGTSDEHIKHKNLLPRPYTEMKTTIQDPLQNKICDPFQSQMVTEQDEFVFDNDQHKKYVENWTKMKTIK